MKTMMLRLSAVLILVLLPMSVEAAAPSTLLIYCGNLPGCPSGFEEHFSSVLSLLLLRVPTYIFALGVLFVMIGGGYMVLSLGEADKVTKGKTTILWALVGILVSQYAQIFINSVIIPEVLTREAGTDLITSVTRTLIGTIFDLLSITMLIVAVYCGMRMVLSFGKEEDFKKYRDGMIWAAIGAIVINLAAGFAHAFCLTNPGVCVVI